MIENQIQPPEANQTSNRKQPYFSRRAAKLALRKFSISIHTAVSFSFPLRGRRIRLAGDSLPGALGSRRRLWRLLGDRNRLLRPRQTGPKCLQDIGYRSPAPARSRPAA